MHPQRRRGGWICGDCEPPHRRVFETREDLWRDHLFEPLLACVNEDLAPAHVLALFGFEESGVTMAHLAASAAAASGATKVVAMRDGF